ncbi:UNVERIFIED_CONTAM: hypothetical protein Sradi_0756900 [Sesamum radiatum]|uniref:Uncharacterized protein n=1 Tax=Sesamum radiatum TaxID=300843 RepID=A0AAW2VQM7_SESRA
MGDAMGLGVVGRDPTGQCLTWLSLQLPRVGYGELGAALAARECPACSLLELGICGS